MNSIFSLVLIFTFLLLDIMIKKHFSRKLNIDTQGFKPANTTQKWIQYSFIGLLFMLFIVLVIVNHYYKPVRELVMWGGVSLIFAIQATILWLLEKSSRRYVLCTVSSIIYLTLFIVLVVFR
jgi:succinate dehydrogenase/fumarate reductase cytochrome b subunit